VSEALSGTPSGRFAKRLFLSCSLWGLTGELAVNPKVREAHLV